MSSTLDHLIPASASIALGAVVESILGFGCNLVWMSFFPLFASVSESVGVHQPLALGLNIIILSRCYKHANIDQIKPLIFTTPLGICFGIWVVTSWPVRWIKGSLGTFLLLYTFFGTKKKKEKSDADVESLKIHTSPSKEGPAIKRPWYMAQSPPSLVAGFLGGALTSAFGTGGPAMLIYAKQNRWDDHPDAFRANIQFIFFGMHSLAILSMIVEDVVTIETAKASACLIPSILVGGFIGTKVASKIPKDFFQILVINGLRVMGVVFLTEAIW